MDGCNLDAISLTRAKNAQGIIRVRLTGAAGQEPRGKGEARQMLRRAVCRRSRNGNLLVTCRCNGQGRKSGGTSGEEYSNQQKD